MGAAALSSTRPSSNVIALLFKPWASAKSCSPAASRCCTRASKRCAGFSVNAASASPCSPAVSCLQSVQLSPFWLMKSSFRSTVRKQSTTTSGVFGRASRSFATASRPCAPCALRSLSTRAPRSSVSTAGFCVKPSPLLTGSVLIRSPFFLPTSLRRPSTGSWSGQASARLKLPSPPPNSSRWKMRSNSSSRIASRTFLPATSASQHRSCVVSVAASGSTSTGSPRSLRCAMRHGSQLFLSWTAPCAPAFFTPSSPRSGIGLCRKLSTLRLPVTSVRLLMSPLTLSADAAFAHSITAGLRIAEADRLLKRNDKAVTSFR